MSYPCRDTIVYVRKLSVLSTTNVSVIAQQGCMIYFKHHRTTATQHGPIDYSCVPKSDSPLVPPQGKTLTVFTTFHG